MNVNYDYISCLAVAGITSQHHFHDRSLEHGSIEAVLTGQIVNDPIWTMALPLEKSKACAVFLRAIINRATSNGETGTYNL